MINFYTTHPKYPYKNTLNIFLIFPDELLKSGVGLQRKSTLKSNSTTSRIKFKPLVSQISVLYSIPGQSFVSCGSACNVKLSVFQTASRPCHTRLEGPHSCTNKKYQVTVRRKGNSALPLHKRGQ